MSGDSSKKANASTAASRAPSPFLMSLYGILTQESLSPRRAPWLCCLHVPSWLMFWIEKLRGAAAPDRRRGGRGTHPTPALARTHAQRESSEHGRDLLFHCCPA